jgi:hypothetical protein
MALHPEFPTLPYFLLVPAQRWFPAEETLRSTAYGTLAPFQYYYAQREAVENGTRYDFLYVDQAGFEKHKPVTLADLATSFTEYKA